jgi:hypothetical protein
MGQTTMRLVHWAPRVCGVLMAAFLALFALDAFDGRSFVAALPYFAVHLIPTFIVLAIVAVAWRVEWFGGAAFLAVALAYALMVNWRMDWVAGVSGPLLVISGLFFASWRQTLAATRTP